MSRVDILAHARGGDSVKFKEFMRIISKEKVPACFEGEDARYYSVRINTIRADIQWSGIDCGGKSKLIKLREDIRSHPHYKNSVCLFFVDADFDDNTKLLAYTDTYVLPCYSIENLYISDKAFKQILSDEFKISESGEESECFSKALSTYQKVKKDYLSAISEFNYWLRAYRLMEKSDPGKDHLNINNINFKALVELDLQEAQAVYDTGSVHLLFPNRDESIEVDMLDSSNYFEAFDKELSFRGKQHLEFLKKFIMLLKEDRCKKNTRKIFNKRGNVDLMLTAGNAISGLSQYAHTPECLSTFLKKFDACFFTN